MHPPKPRKLDYSLGETYAFEKVSAILRSPPPHSEVGPRALAVSRRKFLAMTGLMAMFGAGLSGGADLPERHGRAFGQVLAGVDMERHAGERTAPLRPRPQPAAVQTRLADAVTRLEAPSVGIGGGTIELAIDSAGRLEAPPGPAGVAWYRFSGTPGTSTNVVFAGHVTWHTGEPAAFRRLSELQEGAEIVVTDSLGRRFVYRVFASTEVEPSGPHVAELRGPQPRPICTLISCDGWFDAARRAYTRRRVVQAAL